MSYACTFLNSQLQLATYKHTHTYTERKLLPKRVKITQLTHPEETHPKAAKDTNN